MKYLLVIAVVLVAYWVWRHSRAEEARERQAQQRNAQGSAPPSAEPDALPLQDMVRCRHCGVHLPGNEAVRGVLGAYCGHEHRRLAEG